ncbi:ABC transporter ATP-binding protein [Actinacidiphila bryophytorum]|uniref:ABC-type xenobiotic transporter n=1 Tax=Actinacidiphila bryophytorum TaxID=1436133 RepID=A0A9W4M9D5_9ACTN|nr:ATP-binding cassette domain-containing protein [Actinacidiphila bryophytorum]MBM9440014.1 ATP-binding cassette domain-containing protein [Actinacidiphila bryophytorum]MBN6546386.1 ATP-binding cassette domain-containing protein [Actinacidiphila bryophytorum]CAG7639766.1 Nod factor export ATP-binding protein I [Actinacidiphila bryophytorum]
MADVLIEARGLRKVHAPRGAAAPTEAVAGIDFRVTAGEAFGFLGPNGAGKSTTMRMVAAVSPPSSGRLEILGMDPATHGPQIRARLGSVPQDDTLDTELTVRENLLVYGRYFGLPRAVIRERAARLLEFARLADKADEQVEALSGGMRRRLTIARSLVNDPEILLLDEPTTGLDPQARHLLWERLFRLKQQGVTLLLTTHYMDEAEQLCDRIVVMDHGRIVAEGSPRGLIEAHCTREVLELRFPPDRQQQAAEKIADTAKGVDARVEVLPDRLLVYADDGEDALTAVHRTGVEPLTALVRRAGLEDVFLTLTGRTLVD